MSPGSILALVGFEAIATVEFSSIPAFIPPGTVFTDTLVLDFGTNNQVSDVTDVLSWLGGTDPITPSSVFLDFSNGRLNGSIQGLTISGLTAIDIWANGEGTFAVFGGDVTLTGSNIVKAVPEPAVIALFAVGLLGLGFARRRKA